MHRHHAMCFMAGMSWLDPCLGPSTSDSGTAVKDAYGDARPATRNGRSTCSVALACEGARILVVVDLRSVVYGSQHRRFPTLHTRRLTGVRWDREVN